MPGRKNFRVSDEKKNLGARVSKSCNRPVNLPSTHGLLQGLLMDLGLTETAKVLEEESLRRLQLFSSQSVEPTSILADDATPRELTSNESPNIVNNKIRGTKDISRRHNDDGNGYPISVTMNVGDPDFPLDAPPMDKARMALFCALVHRPGKDAGEATDAGVLHELCRMGISPLGWNVTQSSSAKDDTDITDKYDGKAVSLTPLLQKLFKVLWESGLPTTGHEKGGSETQLPAIFLATWLPLMEVFFAYVEVLWAQVCLVEAVSLADLTAQGWCYHRQCVLECVSLLQEKLQRLLLEAHHLKCSSSNVERPAPHHSKEGKRMGLSTLEESSDSLSTSSSSASEITVLVENMYRGVVALFCHSESTFRENIEEVSTWIMDQCGCQMQRKKTYCPSHKSDKEPNLTDETNESTFLEEEKNSQVNSARSSWNTLMSVVRQTLLGGGGLSSRENFDKNNLPLLSSPRLRWAQTTLRIHVLAWAVGSVAGFVDTFLQHPHFLPVDGSSDARTGGRCGKECKEVLRQPSIVSVVLGFWYQNCAAYISEGISAIRKKYDNSLLHQGIQEEDKAISRLPLRFPHAQLTEEELNIGRSFVNVLKRAAYEFLAGTLTLPTPLHLVLVGGKVPQLTALSSLFNNGGQEVSYAGVIDDKGGDVRTALLSTLITGKLYQLNRVCKSRHVTLSRLLKRSLRRSRLLLDLQDECVSMDTQLRAMENTAVFAILSNTKGNIVAQRGSPNRKSREQTRGSGIQNEHTASRACEENISLSEEAAPVMEPQQQRLSGSSGVGLYLLSNLEETGEPPEPLGSSLFARPQSPIQRRAHSPNDIGHSAETAPTVSDEDAVSSTDHNLDCSGDVLLNEVQIVTVTPCGSLMALLTTKGRLVVFALRAAKTLGVDVVNEEMKESFCERLILDVNLVKGSKEPHWYEQLESFLVFSPSGNFLLCSVQNAPSFVPEGKEANRSCPDTMGKIFIYSLHCIEGEQCGVDGGKANRHDDDVNRLYDVFQIHTTLITVARWLDPRFWRSNSSSDIRPPEEGTPEWKLEAHRRLSVLQCLSSGRDNLILRWSPADGSIIQSIATLPVFDILVSPLMQAFYTINQFGQLSMYDAWNERKIESATDNTVVVSERGLPASLSMMRLFTEMGEEQFTPKSTAPLKDGEKQDDFFVGARIICFDRRCVAQSGAERETIITQVSRLVQRKGLPSGTETRESNRLGRLIVRQVLHPDVDYFTPQAQGVVEPSSSSEDENDSNDNNKGSTRGRGNHSSFHTHNDTVAGASPFFLLRRLHSEDEEKKKSQSCSGTTAKNETSHSQEAVFYRTGSRLVFEEVSRALCHTAGIWTPGHDHQYAPPLQPYHLLSMAASGCPVWNDEDEEGLRTCPGCRRRFYGHLDKSSSPSFCSYYADMPKERETQNNGNRFGRAGAPLKRMEGVRRNFDTVHTCHRLEKNVVLPPVARNGRYLCIAASAGPNRAVVPYNRPLEYYAGIYACIVFDVLFGTVIRVIPVCPVLPREGLTENGVSPFHSNSRRSPIYMLPCSVTVVHQPQRRRSARGSHGAEKCVAAFNHSTHFHEYGEKLMENEGGECVNKDYNSYRDLDDSDSMVLVAVGALHSTTYVFDALTGSRIKVINLRKQKDPHTTPAPTEARPPSKRARCSYVSLGELCASSSCQSNEEEDDDDDVVNLDDDASNSTFGELPSPRSKGQLDNRRQELLRQLAERLGMDTMLKSLTELLCVVPFPFPLFGDAIQESGNCPFKERLISAKPSHLQSSNPCGPSACGSGGALSSSLFSSMFTSSLSCPSFLGQLQMASGGAFSINETPSCVRHSDGEVSANAIKLCHDVPFAFVERRGLRHTVLAGATSNESAANELTPAGIASTLSATASRRVRKRFRCGVVNSVALLYDHVKGGVYVFSSDEYGGLFLAGDVISP